MRPYPVLDFGHWTILLDLQNKLLSLFVSCVLMDCTFWVSVLFHQSQIRWPKYSSTTVFQYLERYKYFSPSVCVTRECSSYGNCRWFGKTEKLRHQSIFWDFSAFLWNCFHNYPMPPHNTYTQRTTPSQGRLYLMIKGISRDYFLITDQTCYVKCHITTTALLMNAQPRNM